MRGTLLLVGVCILTCPGCLVVWHRAVTVRKDEARRAFAFESDAAADLFARSFEKRKLQQPEPDTHTFAIPFVTLYNQTSKLAEAALYNDEAAACDIDANGLLSDAEVVAYSERVGASEELPKTAPVAAGDKIVAQKGFVNVGRHKGVIEVFYPQPFLSPPELTFPEASDPGYEKLEQFANGFRLHLRGDHSRGFLHWQARGIPSDPRSVVERAARLGPPGEVSPVVSQGP
jgi:hypothetical protein